MPNVSVDPPTSHAPLVPDGFQAPTEPIPGPSPAVQQVRDIGDIAAELGNKDYPSHFSKEVAPPQADFTAALSSAKAWSDEVAAAEAWLAYAKVQRDLAWYNAFSFLKAFRPIFEAVLTAKPALVSVYKQTKAFLLVWKVAADKGAATRAAKKKAAKTTNK